MKIDKAAFLFLAGAIAGGACIVKTDGDDDTGAGNGGSGNTGNTGNNGGSGGDGGDGGSVGGQGGQGGEGGGTCDDSVGSPGDCQTTPINACSEGSFDITLCDQAIAYFKPAVAEAAVACIIASEATTTCDDIYACRNDALANACIDDTADSLCADFAGNCTVTEQECHLLVDGMNGDGRTAVETQCGPSVEGCFGGGLFTSLEECVNNLL
jgi:hypothetical protein